MAAYDYARSLIPGQYRDARNRTDAAAALARQSVNEQFAASGLNTGAAGQARLSMAIANQGALSRLDSEQAAALAELDMRRAEAESEYRSAVAEAIASSELERAQALYEEAVRVDASYRDYSQEMLAAWGLTLAGTPIVTEELVSAGSYGGGGASAHSTGKQSSGAAATGASEAELLRQQLSRIPGAHPGEQGGDDTGLLRKRQNKLRRHAVAARRGVRRGEGREAFPFCARLR